MTEELGPAHEKYRCVRRRNNALVDLGNTAYLEIIARDLEQSPLHGRLPFGVRPDMQSQLVGWATRSDAIDTRVAQARAAGYEPGPIHQMQRRAPDGTPLQWRLTGPAPTAPSFLVPLLMVWADTPYPSTSAPTGLRLIDLRAEHPDPATVTAPCMRAGPATGPHRTGNSTDRNTEHTQRTDRITVV